MRERLRERFPEYEVLPTASLMGGVPDEILPPQIPHHRFRSRSPNALVQTGPRLLTINVLPDYPTFDVFRGLIHLVLDHYSQIAEAGSPTRVGLRYINHFPSLPGRTDVADYLKIPISYPGDLPHPPAEVSARFVLPHGDLGSLGLAIGFPARLPDGRVGALLDLDFSWSEPKEFNLDRFPDWLNEAHDVIYSTFVATVVEAVMNQLRGG